MARPVQETTPQQQATKRSAEADPEPSPVTKRTAEDLERKREASTTGAGDAAASKQQPTVAQSAEGHAAQDSAVPSAENEKSARENQPEVTDSKDAENPPPTDQSESQNGVGEVAGHAPDPAAVAAQLATEAAAAQDEAQKVAKVAAQKQAEALEALQAAAGGVPADESPAEPVMKEASESVSAAPQVSEKPVGTGVSSEHQAKDAALRPADQPTGQKNSTATPRQKEPESATNDAPVEVPPQQPAPAPVSETMTTPTSAGTAFPPPLEKLTPANPLPQTASTPLIGNIPPQAVESLKAAAQQAAVILPLQPTQELLAQQVSTRTTPLTQPVDRGVAPMEE